MWDGEVMHSVGVSDLRSPEYPYAAPAQQPKEPSTTTDRAALRSRLLLTCLLCPILCRNNSGDDGRSGFANVHVRMDNQVLQIWYRGSKVVHGLLCPWYAPKTEWTWALGARAGQRADDHWVANMTFMSSNYAVDVGAVSLDLSLNSQDFGAAGRYYAYFGAPEVASISPTSGPADGGTTVAIDGAELADGLHYTCRFGNAGFPEDLHAGWPASMPTSYDPEGHYVRLTDMLQPDWNSALRDADDAAYPYGYTHDPFAARDPSLAQSAGAAGAPGSHDDGTKVVVNATFTPDGSRFTGTVRSPWSPAPRNQPTDVPLICRSAHAPLFPCGHRSAASTRPPTPPGCRTTRRRWCGSR